MKRIVIPMLVAVAVIAQTTVSAFALSMEGMSDLIGEDESIVMEVGEVDAISAAAPISRSTNPTSLSDFTDFNVIKNHWGYEQIRTLFAAGGIAGYQNSDGTYRFDPDKDITTAELLSLILKAANQNLVDDTKAWPARVIDPAIELGIIPSSMSSEANTPITREKMAMILVNSAKAIRNEDTTNFTFDASKISDLNQADSTYRSYIQTAYGMGLLEGSGSGYKPKAATTRTETCTIINRLYEFMPRVEPKENTIEMPTGLSPLPDGSNVGLSGIVYPKEGDVINGVKVERDEETGVLGLGGNGKGGIYLGLVYPTNGVKIELGDVADDFYDNMGGQYTQKGDYIFWDAEWDIIAGVGMRKVEKTANPTKGMVADIHGNLTTGTPYDKDVFFYYNGGYWEFCK